MGIAFDPGEPFRSLRLSRITGTLRCRVLLTKSMNLGLSNQYWICSKDSIICWEDVNFFDNLFSEDIGNMLFGNKISGDIDMMSQTICQTEFSRRDGSSWMENCLIKGGTGTTW